MIKKVMILGAGTMGAGIAQICAVRGCEVRLLDLQTRALERSVQQIEQSLARFVQKGQLAATEQEAALQRIHTTTDMAESAGVDCVIEAVTENVTVKKDILKKVSHDLPAEAILATNTSSLSVTALAAVVQAPERFIGLHFFNPVPLMPLVEVIGALQTSEAVVQRALSFIEHLGKKAICVKNAPGFVVNRILVLMINEAIFAYAERLASAEEIDMAMKLGCNHPIGPLALADMVGLDVCLAVMETLHHTLGEDKYRPAPLLREMVDAGYLGKKTKRGFFSY